ncbi:hypothetical protein PWT90_02858 [Aphanocladium album]|nr:hypothetical protein PWT90_02858 [Aphanocladium album]
MAQMAALPVNGHAAIPGPGRSVLPNRAVTADTIEDAYIAFIFYCNPALPADCDTVSLREAFRNPPRSGGKVFEPFTIYELVRKFYSKEIKTWTELTMKLGVEPPDPSKEESVQKIAQYGVRLKKWLHSMHVKAFFEYLMDMANDYWTNIPMDPNPVAQPIRDGIAVEDDMALRALLPHIRPKRGRKRPNSDNAANGPNQRQRTSPGSTVDEYAPQSAWPHGADPGSTPMDNAPMSAWPPHETLQTPLTRWPASAVTPSTREAFWADEPRSAITPSKAKGPHQRRGAKNVSSAWKLGGEEGPKKTRGRPPINRTPIDTPTTAATAWPQTPNTLQPQGKTEMNVYMRGELPRDSPMTSDQGTPPATMQQMSQAQMAYNDPSQHTPPYPSHNAVPHNQQDGSRPARPNISLQVPQRPSGSVRLATPPIPQPQQTAAAAEEQGPFPSHGQTEQLPTYDNMHAPPPGQPYAEERNGDGTQKWEPISATADAYTATTEHPPGNIPEYYFETMKDRTNIDALMAYFIRLTHESNWYDADGKPTEAASMEEATAIINATLENMYRTAATSQAFLINLAALAGARMLMTNLTRCVRLGEKDDHTAYRCEWEYQFGHLHGYFNMAAAVPFGMWRAKPQKTAGQDGQGTASQAGGGARDPDEPDSSNPRLQAEHWQNKYKTLLGQVDKMDRELFDLRNKVIDSLKTRGD